MARLKGLSKTVCECLFSCCCQFNISMIQLENDKANGLFCFSFGICPHMTEDNKDLIQGKDLLTAYYDVDYEKNAKGSNYWRNR